MDTLAGVAELDRRFGIPGVASVREGNGAMPRVQITSSLCEAGMYLHGAQVTSWKPAGSDEVLFLSAKARWTDGQAIRGGIPVCFPWFRAKANDPQAPAHGFVRTRAWQLESILEEDDAVVVTMVTESGEHTRHWWPGEFRLVHLDNTDSNKEKAQRGDVAIASQTDSAYLNTRNTVELSDPKMRRRIRLAKANSLTTVVWNPWRDKASELRDLGEGEWTQFLCVEASNILDAAVHLEPRQEHRMTAILSVEKL